MNRFVIAACLVLLAGCVVPPPAAEPSPTPTVFEPSVSVPWGDYDASVKARIDELGAESDCAGLQDEFDNADANNDATMNRTGHNNADLMGYIDEWMREAGCYA